MAGQQEAGRRAVKAALREQRIETPSWAFGNSGTRFKVFPQDGVPRTPVREDRRCRERAPVHRDRAERRPAHPVGHRHDYAELSRYAADQGIAIGAINANVFQDQAYMLGSVAHPDPGVRRKAIDHLLRVRRDDGPDRLPGPQALVRRRHELPRPGQHPRPPGPARRGAAARPTAASAGTSGCCWSTSCSSPRSTRPTCPTGAPRMPIAWPWASGPRSCSTPATTRRAPTSSSSWRCCCAPAGSAPSTSTRASTPTTT